MHNQVNPCIRRPVLHLYAPAAFTICSAKILVRSIFWSSRKPEWR